MTTLRRGTRAFEAALDAARPGHVFAHTPSTYYGAQRLDDFYGWHPRQVLEQFSFAKLRREGSLIILCVTSREWYEWALTD